MHAIDSAEVVWNKAIEITERLLDDPDTNIKTLRIANKKQEQALAAWGNELDKLQRGCDE
ncbi:MAG: hypothetical protein V3U78_04510 [Thiotrichaceae bacterium]